MKLTAFLIALLFPAVAVLAQTPESSPSPSQIDALTKKVDEINTKLDALSQEVLKIEQQTARPGVMIGEATPVPVASAEPAHAAGGNSHVVTKGETLTSIAKQYKVGVEELQKFNHIEDGRKLQAGQTIMIPQPGASVSPTASPSPSAGE